MFKLTEQPPHIETVSIRDRVYRLALPSTYIYKSQNIIDQDYRIVFLKFSGDIYFNFPGPSGQSSRNKRDCPVFQYSAESENELMEGYPFIVNENIKIDSLNQWHDLTERNPNFMIEQFNLCDTSINDLTYIKELTQVVSGLPHYLAKRLVDRIPITKSSRQSPMCRTFYYESFLTMLSLPEMVIFELNSYGHRLVLCMMPTTGGRYIPLCLPNVSRFGFACMGPGFKKNNALDYFWNSGFTGSINSFPIRIKENFAIQSMHHWITLSEENPNFFQEQFDPVYAEKFSPIVYTVNNDRLSFEFN